MISRNKITEKSQTELKYNLLYQLTWQLFESREPCNVSMNHRRSLRLTFSSKNVNKTVIVKMPPNQKKYLSMPCVW